MEYIYPATFRKLANLAYTSKATYVARGQEGRASPVKEVLSKFLPQDPEKQVLLVGNDQGGMIEVTNRDQMLRQIHEGRKHENRPANNARLSEEEIFHRFIAVLLKVEAIDLFRRIHNIFPLANPYELEQRLSQSTFPCAIVEINEQFLARPQDFLQETYSPTALARILDLVCDKREEIDFESILKNVLFWLIQGLDYKIGVNLWDKIPVDNLIDNFPSILDGILQKVVDHLVPLFDAAREDEAVVLFSQRPVYLQELIENFDDPLIAGKHVTAVVLNAVAGILERLNSYDFRYIVDQEPLKNPAAFKIKLFIGPDSLQAAINSLFTILEQYGREMDVLVEETKSIVFSTTQSKDDILLEIETKVAQIKQAGDLLLKEAQNIVSTTLADLGNDLFTESFNILEISIKNLINTLARALKKATDSFVKDPTLKAIPLKLNLAIGYPLQSVLIDGWSMVNCKGSDFGFSGGDLVWFNGQLLFFEGYKLDLNSVVRVTYWAFRPLTSRNEGRINFNKVQWLNSQNVRKEAFTIYKRWGEYDPTTYGYDPLSRKDSFEINNNHCSVVEQIVSIRNDFLKPLIKLQEEIAKTQKGQALGRSILHHIIATVNRPTGKELPLRLRLLYHDRDVYSVNPFAPPSSSGKNVLRLEISTGCNRSASPEKRCTYCNLYEWEDFSLIKFGRFQRQFSLIQEYLGADSLTNFDRVFLSGGNGLVMPLNRLLEILTYIRDNKRGKTRSIESYATTRAILKHGEAGLKKLRAAGLNLVYWGVESGADAVLALVNKGFTKDDVLAAGKLLRRADLNASVTVMPGLGGVKYAQAHAEETAAVMGEVLPEYLTFMSVHAPGTLYEEAIRAATDNRPLTRDELIEHMRLMKDLYLQAARSNPLCGIRTTMIAAHPPSVTPACFNPTAFKVKI